MPVKKPRVKATNLKRAQAGPSKVREPEDYYLVTVKSAFFAYQTLFQPSQQYHVKPKIYDSTEPVSGNKPFREMCASADLVKM